jgi:hypothetical protein
MSNWGIFVSIFARTSFFVPYFISQHKMYMLFVAIISLFLYDPTVCLFCQMYWLPLEIIKNVIPLRCF